MRARTASSNTVTVGLIQTHALRLPADNLTHTIRLIKRAKLRGAQIVCLQELFSTRYFPQQKNERYFKWAEPIPGPTTGRLCSLARNLEIVIIAPLFEQRPDGAYHNSAAIIDANGDITGIYRKTHIPNDPGFFEKFYFAHGDAGPLCSKTRYGTLGILICWDQWFPEPARLAALAGAQIIFYPSAIGWPDADRHDAQRQQDAWKTVQRSHAIANGVFVACVNRHGKEGKINFWGQSFICDPFGKVLSSAPKNKDRILLACCDLSAIESTRQDWPFLKERRFDIRGPFEPTLSKK